MYELFPNSWHEDLGAAYTRANTVLLLLLQIDQRQDKANYYGFKLTVCTGKQSSVNSEKIHEAIWMERVLLHWMKAYFGVFITKRRSKGMKLKILISGDVMLVWTERGQWLPGVTRIYGRKHTHKVSCPATRHWGGWGGRRYSSYSFFTSALDGGEWSASRPGRA
jgi:hypothetical protein